MICLGKIYGTLLLGVSVAPAEFRFSWWCVGGRGVCFFGGVFLLLFSFCFMFLLTYCGSIIEIHPAWLDSQLPEGKAGA